MTVFDVASLLKLYLRQLPEPLIPYCLYTSFLDVIKFIPDTFDKIKAFQYLFMMLPPAHLVLLETLLQFLSEIVAHSEENHMDAHNLACIFSPNLLRSKESASTTNILSISSSEEYEVALVVIEFLISNRNYLCITSPEVKPFQLFNKFGKDVIPSSVENKEGNTITVADLTSFQKNNIMAKVAASSNVKPININTDKSSHLKNEIMANKISTDSPSASSASDSINNLQSYNPISYSTTNMKLNDSVDSSLDSAKSLTNGKAGLQDSMEDADINSKARHPMLHPLDISFDSTNPSPTSYSNPVSPFSIAIKSKSNLENVRSHPEAFYAFNTCPLVSTSLNRLNYLPIKSDEFYEYLARDNDNISTSRASKYLFKICIYNVHCFIFFFFNRIKY